MRIAVPTRNTVTALAPHAEDSPSAAAQWYLVQLKPGGFERARRNLERQGFVSFMPLRWETRPGNVRATHSLLPLFPGYLFVLFRPGESRWRSINSTYGVARVVCLDGNRPTTVPDGLIRSLRAACDTQGVMHQRETLSPGQTVRVIAGPFTGIMSRIEAVPGPERVLILLEIMGRMVETMVSAAQVEVL